MQFCFAGGLAALSRFIDDEAYPALHGTTGTLIPNANSGEAEFLFTAMCC